jgi:hypothetical protein
MTDSSQNQSEFAPSSAVNAWVPQFTRTEYGKTAKKHCNLCSHPIFSEYFLVNGKKVCATCAEQARSGLSTSSRGSLIGATIVGALGAVVGMIFYSALTSVTGWTVGYFGIFVGYIVGKAVMAGAGGVGGFRLQVVAAAFTYVAIALNGLPSMVYGLYNASRSFFDLESTLPTFLANGLTAPLSQLSANPVSGSVAALVLLVAFSIAWHTARARVQVVAGPFSLTPIGK